MSWPEFTIDQEERICEIYDAAQNLMKVLLTKPEYIKDPYVEGYNINCGIYPISPARVAETVTDMMKEYTGSPIFFPTVVSDGRTGDEHIVDYL